MLAGVAVAVARALGEATAAIQTGGAQLFRVGLSVGAAVLTLEAARLLAAASALERYARVLQQSERD